MKKLWVEKYRPKKVSDYVWRDDHQKQIVLKWIEEKSLPNILLSGQAGAGKCLEGEEEIIVMIDTSILSKEQLEKLKQFKK